MKKWKGAVPALALAMLFAACGQPDASSLPPVSLAPESVTVEPERPILPGTNPLTGMHDPNRPEDLRPLAVMVDNIRLALPQSGVASADLTYEMVTEGGITRLMCVFSDYENMPRVGPVRSARDQHVQMMIPMAALYMHVGGSTYATSMLADYGWQNKDLDAKKYAATALSFDQERFEKINSSEQCWFTDGELAASTLALAELDTRMPEGAIRGPVFQFVPYDQPRRELEGGVAKDIYLRFSGYSNSRFAYDEATGRYKKWVYGEPHQDAATGKQLEYDNLFLLFTDIQKYPDGILAKVDFSVNGVGYYISGGRYEKVRWVKGSPQAPLRILAGDGSEMDVWVNPGKSYIAFADFAEHDYLKIDGAQETKNAVEDPGVASPEEEQEAED